MGDAPRVACVLLLMLVGCGRLDFARLDGGDDAAAPVDADGDAGGAPDASGDSAAPEVDGGARCSAWGPFGAPVQVYDEPGRDDWPSSITEDELTLVTHPFSRSTSNDLFITTRGSLGEAFPPAVAMTELNTPQRDASALLSDDGLSIWISSDRPGGAGDWDLWFAERANTAAPFDAPRWIPELATDQSEVFPTLTADGTTIFFGSRRVGGVGMGDIWTAERADRATPFGPPVLVASLSTANREGTPEISADGLEIFFMSDRPGGLGDLDLWRATRPDRASPFGSPTNVTELNTTLQDLFPRLVAGGAALYFTQGASLTGGTDVAVWRAARGCLVGGSTM